MKYSLLLGTIAIGWLSACGGNGGQGDDDVTGDAGVDARQGPCDPLLPPNQQNCEVGQRCTWIVDQVGPPSTGHVGCVTDGTLPAGAPCEASAAGQPDRCTTGLYCVAGTCQKVCGFDGGATTGCPADQACARHAGAFADNDDTPFAGVCRPSCDPLSQTRTAGGSCDKGQGCYLITSATETVAVCAKAGTGMHGEDLSGSIYANSCVPGAQPRRKNSSSDTVQCGGLCKPIDSVRGSFGSEGGLAPDSCAVRWGAAPADDGGLGESCRFWYGRERFAGLSPYSNTVGWCFRHTAFLYDPDGDGTLDSQFPRCAAAGMDDVLPPVGNPPHNDAAYFWCIALSGGTRLPMFAPHPMRADRVLE